MNLQRMIVIPSHTFEKWKRVVLHDQKLSSLDKNMKSILNNSKLNDISKWQLYRQNLMNFTNSMRLHKKNSINNAAPKRLMDVSTETQETQKRNKLIETDNIVMKDEETDTGDLQNPFIPVKGKKLKVSPAKTMDEIFRTSNSFANLDENDFEKSASDNEQNYSLDQDDTITRRALEGHPPHVKILRERKSMNPEEYRAFDLNNGEQVNVPVEKRLTRARAKGMETKFTPPQKSKNKKASSSTPSKSKKQKGGGIGNSLLKSIPWIVYK